MIISKLKSFGLWLLGIGIAVLGFLAMFFKAKADRTEKEMAQRETKAARSQAESLQHAQQAQQQARDYGQEKLKEVIDETDNLDRPRDHFTRQL